MAAVNQNFINLHCVQIPLANRIVREIFFIQWLKKTRSNQWNHTIEQGNLFVTGIGKKSWTTSSRRQKLLIQSGNANLWDLKLCNHILQKTDFESENELSELQKTRLSELASIQNVIYKNYKTIVSNNEYKEIMHKIEEELKYLSFGEFIENFDLQDIPSRKPLIDKSNNISAHYFKEMADSFYTEHKFVDAINLYNQAINLNEISVELLGTLYSNRSAVYLLMSDVEDTIHLALEDAKRAIQLRPEWFYGYSCLGCTYKMLEKYEKAFKYFSIAAELEQSEMDIISLRDECEKKIPKLISPYLMVLVQNQSHYRNYFHKNFGKLSPAEQQCRRNNDDPHFLIWKAVSLLITNHRQDFHINDKQAFTLFKTAADLGDDLALYYVGVMYRFGVGVRKDVKKSVELFKLVASLPLAKNQLENISVGNAMCDLGRMYEKGEGVYFDLEEAVKLYKKASKHGNEVAAYQLGEMFITGRGVKENDVKAMQYFKLAAKQNNSLAMQSLAYYYFNAQKPSEAFKWYQQAIRNGIMAVISTSQRLKAKFRLLQKKIEDLLDEKQQFDFFQDDENSSASESKKDKKNQNSEENSTFDTNEVFPEFYKSVDTFIKQQIFPAAIANEFAMNILDKYANKGSDIAKGMKKSITHYTTACQLLNENNKKLAPEIIHEFAESIRSSAWVYIGNKFDIAVNTILKTNIRLKKLSQLDYDLRVCIINNTTGILFVDETIKLYPNDVLFVEYLCLFYGAQKDFQQGLEITEKALLQFPNNYNLWFRKIGYALQLETKNLKFLETCEKFLELAPPDHPNIPKTFYLMGLKCLEVEIGKNKAINYYKMGLEAEKNQLPFFLQFACPEREYLEKLLMHKNEDIMMNPAIAAGGVDRTSDAYRIETIVTHREMISCMLSYNFKTKFNWTPRPDYSAYLHGSEPIFLRTMNPISDQVYQERSLTCKIIDEPLICLNRIYFVIQDGNGDVELATVCFTTQDKIRYNFAYGSNITILNPFWQVAMDGKLMIYVDSVELVIFNMGENATQCRYCGKINSFLKCGRCCRVVYCSKKCQLDDWHILKHKLICYANLL